MPGFLMTRNRLAGRRDRGMDVNSIMRDMTSIILKDILDQERDEKLGYSQYDYRNKKTEMSILRKLCIPAIAIGKSIFPGTERISLNHKSSRNTRIPFHRTWKKTSFPCMPKNVLGIYVGQNERAKFCRFLLNGLKNHDVRKIS